MKLTHTLVGVSGILVQSLPVLFLVLHIKKQGLVSDAHSVIGITLK